MCHFADEKEKYDPNGFRDALVQGLERSGGELDAAYKYLDAAGSKLDYRRYGEVIFDVLIAGGLLRKYPRQINKPVKELSCHMCNIFELLTGETPLAKLCLTAVVMIQ